MSSTSLRSRRAHLLCSSGLVMAGMMLAATAAAAQETQTMETVVITGSRLAVSTAYDAPTPVTVVGAEDFHLAGTTNVEQLLNQSPQFLPSTNGGASGNTIQGNGDSGAALLNLRGLGEVRSLVLVNGRRFAIQGTRLTTDVNTIPATLVERTEVVTGGNSAVYGSDAISGVVNFVMKKDFEGVAGGAQITFDEFTQTPIFNADLTIGGNFAGGKGNIVTAVNYMSRGGITQAEHGRWAAVPYSDACVTKDSFSPNVPGARLNGTSGAACVAAGGVNGFVVSGSGDTPNAFIRVTGGSPFSSYSKAAPALQTLMATAGMTGMGNDGLFFTNSDAAFPATYRNRDTNVDLYNTTQDNYMQIPQQRWMVNTFANYDFNKHVQAYAEFHFSSNRVSAQLTPSSMKDVALINTHNPAFNPALQSVMDYLDQHESGTTTVMNGTIASTTTPGDGLVALSVGKRLIEGGYRRQDASRYAYRFAGGFKGEVGSVTDKFLKDITYDVYYTYARTEEMDAQSGSVWKSKWAANLRTAVNGDTPVCNPFGLDVLSKQCMSAVMVNASQDTVAEMQDINLSVTGTAFDLPAGPVQFAVGGEWRYTMAKYTPDMLTATGDAGFNTTTATSGSMVSHELYGEIRVPVVKDLPLVENFSVNSAFRYSDYNLSSAHDIWTWSFGADWRVIPDLSFRGQYQRATRAPNVGELWGGMAANTDGGLVDPCGAKAVFAKPEDKARAQTLCLAQGVSQSNLWTSVIQGQTDLMRYYSGGSATLKPETADTITLGAVIQPEALPGLAASVDFYSIQVKDMIGTIGAGSVLSNCFGQSDPNNMYCKQIVRVNQSLLGNTGYIIAGNSNISSMKTQGFDFNTNYSFDVDFGLLSSKSNFKVGTAWNWLLEMVSQPDVTNPSTKSSCAGTYGNTYCLIQPMPRLKSTTHVTWSDGPLTLNLKWRFTGSVVFDKYLVPARRGVAGMDMANFSAAKLPDMSYFDLSASYDINDNIEIYGGMNNLFSKDPPVVGSGAAGSYANSFPATYDAFGRVTYIGIKAKTN